MKRLILLLSVMVFIVILAGCSLFGGDELEYEDMESDDTVLEYVTPTPSVPTYENDSEPGNNEPQNKSDKSESSDTSTVMMSITPYYQDEEGYIIPATRKVAKQIGIARATINATIDNSINREDVAYHGLYPVLPKGTEILGINLKEGTAVIDFNPKVFDYENEQSERNIISTIVYTLTEFDTIDNVRILVNGYKQSELKFGTDISGPLDRNNILINSYKTNLDKGLDKSDIYLYRSVNNQYDYLVPVSVEHTRISEDQLPGKLIDLLSSEYSNDEFYSELPVSTKLVKSSIQDNVLIVDLNNEIKNYSGISRENFIVNQIYHTMKQVSGAQKIKVYINGSSAILPEGTNISQTVFFPCNINSISK